MWNGDKPGRRGQADNTNTLGDFQEAVNEKLAAVQDFLPRINQRQNRNGDGEFPMGNRMQQAGLNTFSSNAASDRDSDAYDFRRSRENYRTDQPYETVESIKAGLNSF